MTSRRRTVQDYLYDSSEHTATCCLGDVFFRKRRLTSASDYGPSLKPKLPLDDDDDDDDVNNDNDDTSGRLASSTERTLAAAGPGVNLNSKYQGQGSSDDNSRGTRLADNDSYSRAVSHPVPGLAGTGGSRHGSLQDSLDPPPRYTPTRDDPPLPPPPPLPLQTGTSAASAAPPTRNRHRSRPVSAGRLTKEHEMLQNFWLESHGRTGRQQRGENDGAGAGGQQRPCRRSSSVGSTSRTVYVIDRATGTTYRRGRLLGKVRLATTCIARMIHNTSVDTGDDVTYRPMHAFSTFGSEIQANISLM